MLITVLIVTAVGLLFGAGALLLFRYQCQQRIDRQHELEKVYAVRSAMNYIRTYSSVIPDVGMPFRYYTGSARDLGLLIRPVSPRFPSLETHFRMERGDGLFPVRSDEVNNPTDYEFGKFQGVGGYCRSLDYEYGAIGVTNLLMSNTDGKSDKPNVGLAFKDFSATNGVKWWVNIGMRGTGGWLEEDYGRRYYFYLKNCVGLANDDETTEIKRDLIRLCIIRNVTNELEDVGCRRGWPLSQEDERAVVFETSLMTGDNSALSLYEYVYKAGIIHTNLLLRQEKCQARYGMGFQISDNKITMFYVYNAGGYFFSPTVDLSPQTYAYFAQEQTIGTGVGRKTYGGVVTNEYGKIKAPELRAVFEVEASSSLRPSATRDSDVDFLSNFKVTPAYQYDIYLEHPTLVTNRATVAQIFGMYNRDVPGYTVLTYDTHGTENKGFRKDEREAERKRNGR